MDQSTSSKAFGNDAAIVRTEIDGLGVPDQSEGESGSRFEVLEQGTMPALVWEGWGRMLLVVCMYGILLLPWVDSTGTIMQPAGCASNCPSINGLTAWLAFTIMASPLGAIPLLTLFPTALAVTFWPKRWITALYWISLIAWVLAVAAITDVFISSAEPASRVLPSPFLALALGLAAAMLQSRVLLAKTKALWLESLHVRLVLVLFLYVLMSLPWFDTTGTDAGLGCRPNCAPGSAWLLGLLFCGLPLIPFLFLLPSALLAVLWRSRVSRALYRLVLLPSVASTSLLGLSFIGQFFLAPLLAVMVALFLGGLELRDLSKGGQERSKAGVQPASLPGPTSRS